MTLIATNLFFVFWNILSFSLIIPRLLKGNNFAFASGVTLGVINIICILYFNYYQLIIKAKKKNNQDIYIKDNIEESYKRISERLKVLDNINEFKEDLKEVKKQVERINSKKEKLDITLEKKFNITEITYNRFSAIIDAVYELFLNNTSTIINKVETFDLKEYRYLQEELTKKEHKDIFDKKLELFNSYFRTIKETVLENEEIIFKLDNLLLELSNIIDEDINLDESLEVKELENLIKNTNLYQ